MKYPSAEDYQSLTKAHYQNAAVAQRYRAEYEGPLSFRNIPARIIALRERKIIRDLLFRFVQPNQSILDIPCGTGKLAQTLGGLGSQVVAADISREMLHWAMVDYQSLSRLQGFVQSDASATAFSARGFDCVVCLRLLHRVPMSIRGEILKELSRITRRYVVVSFGIIDGFQRIRLRLRGFMTRGIPSPYPATMSSLRQEIHQAGLTILEIRGVLPALSSEVIVLCERPQLHEE